MIPIPGPIISPRHRSGFSFVEILFAVMILGIGFILVAGVFPVAINQTQANGDETTAATLARRAAAVVTNMPGTAQAMTPDNTVHSFGPASGDMTLWQQVCGNLILPEDPRFAWVPFYLRGTDANGLPLSSAELIVIGVRARNHDAYNTTAGGSDLPTSPTATTIGALYGNSVQVQITAGAGLNNPDTIQFTGGAGIGAAAPGAYVIISSDPNGGANGWVLRLGAPLGNSRFNLQPGGDVKNSPNYKPTAAKTAAFIVGAGPDPENPSNFAGDSQAVMAYTTYVPLN